MKILSHLRNLFYDNIKRLLVFTLFFQKNPLYLIISCGTKFYSWWFLSVVLINPSSYLLYTSFIELITFFHKLYIWLYINKIYKLKICLYPYNPFQHQYTLKLNNLSLQNKIFYHDPQTIIFKSLSLENQASGNVLQMYHTKIEDKWSLRQMSKI